MMISNLFKSKDVFGDNALHEAEELIKSISLAKKDWINTYLDFEYATEPDMINYYIYKLKACQQWYENLLKRAKEKGIKGQILDSDSIINKLYYKNT